MVYEDRTTSSAARPCPGCRRDDGRARSITVDQDLRTVRYVCQACQHEWHESFSAGEQALFAGKAE